MTAIILKHLNSFNNDNIAFVITHLVNPEVYKLVIQIPKSKSMITPSSLKSKVSLKSSSRKTKSY